MAQSDTEVDAVLATVGLSHLAQRFAAEDIDRSVFWSLKDQDLIEMGLSLGQRKKLLEHLKLGRAPTPVPPELRRLTVLFADLVGFTDLSIRVDPDDMRAILLNYYSAARAAARSFGGFIASLQGDGVVMLFGYPNTRAQSADRAVGAAHALMTGLRGFSHRLPDGGEFGIAARIGIASGRAIVHFPDGLAHGEPQIVGPVTNRAARLQSITNPGTVVVDEPTRQLVSSAFSFEPLSDASLKGFDGRVQVFLALPPASTPSKQAEGAAPERATFSAHEREEQALVTALRQARADQPVLALMTGEAGIGKSSLLARFTATAVGEGAIVQNLACSALAANTPLWPVVELLEGTLGGTADSSPGARREALRTLLSSATEEELAAVASYLGLDDLSQVRLATPQESRRLLFDALETFLTGNDERPRLITVEDIHWADDSTRALLQACAERAPRGGMMMLATSRESDDPLWGDSSNHRLHLPLGPLDLKAAESVLLHHLPGQALPENVVQTILARSDGNPLMIEVLTRSAKDWQDVFPGHELRVPTSIYESISGRLERLQTGRMLASALAVFDEPTNGEMLASVLGIEPDELERDVAELVDAGIVETDGSGPQQIVRFRHNLFRAVCYERLVKSARQKLHRVAYSTLIKFDANIAAQRPGLLALHAFEGGDHAQAAPLAYAAGELALRRSALIEASHFLREALTSLDQVKGTLENDQLRLRVLVSSAAIARARQGIAAVEVGDLGRQVLDLARTLGESRSELVALSGLYAHSLVRADYVEARTWADRLCDAARAAKDQTFLMIGDRGRGVVAFHTGELNEAAALLRVALDSYDERNHAQLAHLHGYDHAEICAVFLSFTLWIKGDLAGAAAISTFSIDHSHRIQHMHSLAQALVFRSMLMATARNFGASAASAREAIEVSTKHGLGAMLGVSSFFEELCVLSLSPNAPSGLQLASLRERHLKLKQVNPYNYLGLTGAMLADLHLMGGEAALADGALCEADTVQNQTGEVFARPELMRIRARALSFQGDSAAAQEKLLAAFEDAEMMGAKAFALRIACDLFEADRSTAALNRLRSARLHLVSEDDGWDIRRCQALLHTAESES